MDSTMRVGGSGEAFSMLSKEIMTLKTAQLNQSSSELKRAEANGYKPTFSETQMIRALERAIKAMEGHQTSLEFSVHEATKQIMVKVMNSENGEIIREIPPEKTLDFVAKLCEMAGLFIDEQK